MATRKLFKWAVSSALTLLLFGACAGLLFAQESILSFSIDPERVVIAPGGESQGRVVVNNTSSYEADAVTIAFTPLDDVVVDPTLATLERLAPFSKAALLISLAAAEVLSVGEHVLVAEVVYTYCIEDTCFEIVDTVSLSLTVEAGVIGASPLPEPSSLIWKWLAPTLGALLLAGTVLLWRFARLTIPLYGVCILIIGGGIAWGVMLNQHNQAQGIGAVLCTSCVGIEEARYETPQLSATARAVLDTLVSDVQLLVFYAPWCHSCPYAKAMVEALAAASEHVTYRFVNVEEEPALATAHGVVRSRRTVVPAILRVDTDEVLFGIEHLETRLLKLVGVTP